MQHSIAANATRIELQDAPDWAAEQREERGKGGRNEVSKEGS